MECHKWIELLTRRRVRQQIENFLLIIENFSLVLHSFGLPSSALVDQFSGSGSLVLNYFYFFAPNTHCALVDALLEKKLVPFSMAIENVDSCTGVFSNTRAWEQQE